MANVLFRTKWGTAITRTIKATNEQKRTVITSDAYFKGNGEVYAKELAKRHGASGALGIVDLCLKSKPADNFFLLARKTLVKILAAKAS